ncbi:hypothetical protein QTV49_001831 [Vibrio vulnificus]|nr:hypothetical protein [Vibrio vulnificus]
MSNRLIKEIKLGIRNIKALGYRYITYIPRLESDKDSVNDRLIYGKTKRKSSDINDTNPVCRRLFEIFSIDGVLQSAEQINIDEIALKVTKPCIVNDAFFKEGFFILSK